jgi:hypothetical protein
LKIARILKFAKIIIRIVSRFLMRRNYECNSNYATHARLFPLNFCNECH